METVTSTAKVSEDGTLTVNVPPSFKGATVEVRVKKMKAKPDGPIDKNGWPIGFFEKYVGCITDPAFKRYPQGEADSAPSFE